MWHFRHKYLADGMLSRYKDRLVANDSTRLMGIDVDETFSLIVKPETISLSLWAQVGIMCLVSAVCILYYYGGFHHSRYLLHWIISYLHQEFAMTDLGSLNYFLGMFVAWDSSGMFLSQKKYAVEFLERASMANCNPSWTSYDTESKLGTTGDVVSDSTVYRSLACSDNVSAVYLSCNPVQHQRTKHIEIDIHFVRDLVAAGEVR
nr:ribonuclease H-like domain-containing protein [Tanacetum cinerariifolium]